MKQRTTTIFSLLVALSAVHHVNGDFFSIPHLRSTAATRQVVEDASCPEQHCAKEAVTFGPFPECVSADLGLVEIQTYSYGNDVPLIKLLGPANPGDAAGIVLTVAHGGSLKPSYIPSRSSSRHSEYCPSSGCKTFRDSYTKEIALETAEHVISNYCKVPYVVVNELHRSRLDANREIGEAAQGNVIAEEAWESFHNFIADAQELVKAEFGTVTGEDGLIGMQGILIDVHGYVGKDWDRENGSPLIQWGYRFTKDALDPNNFCPLDDRPKSYQASTLSHARNMQGHSIECLVRGPQSLGSRMADQVPLLDDSVMCGKGLPSLDFPSPAALASDPEWCEDAASDPTDTCSYQVGDYNTEMHEYVDDWRNKQGDTRMNAVQVEFPRCIRFATGSSTREFHPQVGNAMSIALCSFLQDLFPLANTCG